MKDILTKYIGAYKTQKQNDINNTLRCDGAIEALELVAKEVDNAGRQAAEQGTAVPESKEGTTKASPNRTKKSKRTGNSPKA